MSRRQEAKGRNKLTVFTMDIPEGPKGFGFGPITYSLMIWADDCTKSDW